MTLGAVEIETLSFSRFYSSVPWMTVFQVSSLFWTFSLSILIVNIIEYLSCTLLTFDLFRPSQQPWQNELLFLFLLSTWENGQWQLKYLAESWLVSRRAWVWTQVSDSWGHIPHHSVWHSFPASLLKLETKLSAVLLGMCSDIGKVHVSPCHFKYCSKYYLGPNYLIPWLSVPLA